MFTCLPPATAFGESVSYGKEQGLWSYIELGLNPNSIIYSVTVGM